MITSNTLHTYLHAILTYQLGHAIAMETLVTIMLASITMNGLIESFSLLAHQSITYFYREKVVQVLNN